MNVSEESVTCAWVSEARDRKCHTIKSLATRQSSWKASPTMLLSPTCKSANLPNAMSTVVKTVGRAAASAWDHLGGR